jgi:phage repressor protein C with HTH and peptisase S24 domain
MQSDSRYAALRMPTNDMRPRICVGEAVIYDTESKAEPGDDVVILLVDGGSIVRGLLGLTDDGYRLKSYSPAAVGAMPAARVKAIYPVVLRGHAEFVQEIDDADAH